MRGGGAGTGGGVQNWLNKPNLVHSRQGLIGPMKGPAPPGERRHRQGGTVADDEVPVPGPGVADKPSTPKATKYGRKAPVCHKTPATPPLLLEAGSAGKRRKKVNASLKKVVKMNTKEQAEVKNKMKNIRTFFMKLTADDKLKEDDGGGGKERNMMMPKEVGGDEKTAEVPGESNVVISVVEGGESSDMDKVSAVNSVSNVFDTQIVRGEMYCVRGDTDGGVVRSGPGEVSVRQHDDGGGQEQDEGDVGGLLYSSVQCKDDEKVGTEPVWSMKSGRLPRKSDQNQTLGDVQCDGMFQNSRRRLQSRILLRGGNIQSDILADNTTRNGRHRKTHGMTGN